MAVDNEKVLPKIESKTKVLNVSSMDLGVEVELMRKRVEHMKQNRLDSTVVGRDSRLKIANKKGEGEETKKRMKVESKIDPYEASKIALKEKAKLYKKIKRGEMDDIGEVMVADGGDADRRRRRWESDGESSGRSESDGGSTSDNDDDLIEITDSFGRSRFVPASKAYKYENDGLHGLSDDDNSDDKVKRPKNLVYGDTIQHEAFKIDSSAVEEVHAREARDEDIHYDAEWERRDRGAGFYKFSKDEEQRKREMENLQNINKKIIEESEEVVKSRERRRLEFESRIEEIKSLKEANLKRLGSNA